MNKLKVKILCAISGLLLSNSQAMELSSSLDRSSMLGNYMRDNKHRVSDGRVEREYEAARRALGDFKSSEHDIVVLFGIDGVGKSTTGNLLAKKKLTVEHGSIVLPNPPNPGSFKIGLGAEPGTIYPQAVTSGGLTIVDTPSFLNSTQSKERALVNAAFLKSIVEEAKTARIVLVLPESHVTEDDGEKAKKSLDMLKITFDEACLSNSACIVTRTQNSVDELVEIFTKRLTDDGEDTKLLLKQIDIWHREGRLLLMRQLQSSDTTQQDIMWLEDGKTMLTALQSLPITKIKRIDVGPFYSYYEMEKELFVIFENTMFRRLARYKPEYRSADGMMALHIAEAAINRMKSDDFCREFSSDLQQNHMIKILKRLVSGVYDQALGQFRQSDLRNFIADLESKLETRQNYLRNRVESAIKSRVLSIAPGADLSLLSAWSTQVYAWVCEENIAAITDENKERLFVHESYIKFMLEQREMEVMRSLSYHQLRQLQPEQVKALSAKQISAIKSGNISALSKECIACLSDVQITALTNGQILKLSKEQLRALQPNHIKKLSAAQMFQLSWHGLACLAENCIEVLTKAQRAVVYDNVEYKILNMSPQQLKKLDLVQTTNLMNSLVNSMHVMKLFRAEQIEALSQEQIQQISSDLIVYLSKLCLNKLNITMLTPEQKNVYERRKIIVAGDIQKLTAEQIGQLSAKEIEALEPEQIQSLLQSQIQAVKPDKIVLLFQNLSPKQASWVNLSHITNSGVQTKQGLTPVSALVPWLLQEDTLSLIKQHEMGYLSESFIAALEPEQISLIKPEQIAQLLEKQIRAFKPEQIVKLSEVQTKAIPVDKLAYIADSCLARLNKSWMTDDQNSVHDILLMSPLEIAKLSLAQVQAFSQAQVQALSAEQIAALTKEQVHVLPIYGSAASMHGTNIAAMNRINLASYSLLTSEQMDDFTMQRVINIDPWFISPSQMRSLKLEQLGSLLNVACIPYSSLMILTPEQRKYLNQAVQQQLENRENSGV